LIKWLNWRWRLWRARHYAWLAYVDYCKDRNAGPARMKRAMHKVDEIRLER
jgi:hypothetical protein